MTRRVLGVTLLLLVVAVARVAAQQGLLINGSRTIAGTINAATTTGTGAAYLMSLDPPITGYIVNQCFTFKAHVTNTGAATLNVNGVAIRPLKKYVGTVLSDLVAGDITIGQIVLTCYDGTNMQMVGAGFTGTSGGALGYTAENVVNKATSTALGTSDTAYPSQNAVKSYVDSGLGGKQATLGFTPENSTNKSNVATLGTSATAYPTQGAVKSYIDSGLASKQEALGFTPENFLNKSTLTTLGSSDILYPTQNAVKAYVDAGLATKANVGGGGLSYTPEDVANKASSVLLGNSNTLYPTQGAVKSYVDTGLNAKQATLGFAPENATNKSDVSNLGTSPTLYPTQRAVKAYIDAGLATKADVGGGFAYTPEDVANKSDITGLGTSTTAYPTQRAVKAYVDAQVATRQATLTYTPEDVANKSDNEALGTSTTAYATQRAIKAYVDARVAAGGGAPKPGDARNASDFGVVCDGGTPTSVALQAAIDAVPAGTRLIVPGGVCMMNSSLVISKAMHLQGAGMDNTYLRNTVTNIPVLTVTTSNVHVSEMTIMHHTMPVAGGDGLIVRGVTGESLQGVWITKVSASWNWRGMVLGCMAYGMIFQTVAQKNNSHGWEFVYEGEPGCGVDQWDLLHVNATLNKGVGFYGNNTVYAFGLGPFMWNATSFGNNLGGYVFIGTPGHPINDIRLHNVLSSADNGIGAIYLDTYGGAHIISEPWIEYAGVLGGLPIGFDNATNVQSNTGHCLALTGNNSTTTITGGLYWNCAWSGAALYAPYTTMTGGTSQGNGQALHGDLARRAGVAIGATGVQLSGHTFQGGQSFVGSGAGTLFYIHLAGAIQNLAIGVNSYSPELSPQNFLADQATMSNLRLPTLVAGTSIHTNTSASPGLQLYDATQGTAPLKLLRVANGQLQVLNAAGIAVVQATDDIGNFAITGDAVKPAGGLWGSASDERLKQDIRPFDDSLDVLMQLDPIWYKYNGRGGIRADGRDYVGLRAQAVEPVAPYLVRRQPGQLEPDGPPTELLTLDGSPLVYMLVNAVKTLHTTQQTQAQRVEALEAQLAQQATRLTALEAALPVSKEKSP